MNKKKSMNTGKKAMNKKYDLKKMSAVFKDYSFWLTDKQ